MKHTIFLLITGILTLSTHAQDFIIVHDLQKEKTVYKKVGKHSDTSEVTQINIRKNGRIIVQIDNFNPFYWAAKVTTYKKPIDNQASSAGVFNPFSILAQGFGSFISSSLPKMDMPTKNSDGFSGQVSANTVTTLALYKRNYEQLVLMEDRLNELERLKVKLNSLKININKDEATIKKEAAEAMQKTLGTTHLEVEDALTMGSNWDKTFQQLIDSSLLLQNILTKQQNGINPSTGNPSIMMRSSSGKLLSIDKFNEENPSPFLERVNSIAATYQDISSASFKFAYVVNADPDISDLKLELFSKADPSRKDTIVKYFSVRGKGNFKLRNSMGIAFSYFADNNRSYYVNQSNNQIAQSSGDFFTPVLSTFMHFYGGGPARLKWGGALGFGIPLQGVQKDINFLLGLSAILGINEPILLTAGISGAKVNKLDKGYKVGDVVSSNSFIIPTKSVYQPGVFIAVSFILSSLTRRN